MERLLSPKSTVAVIFGAHDWARAGLQNAPSFRRSAAQFQRYLLGASPFGLGLEPDLLLYMFDDPSPAGAQLTRIGETITDLVRERRETLQRIKDILVYFIGHATFDDGHLNFLVRDTRQGIEAQTGIAAPALARVLRVAAPQQRRLVILDCCFSEAAADGFGAMGPLDEAIATAALYDLEPQVPPPDRGTLLLCSSPRSRPSIGKPHDERTLFTGALLDILTEGSHRRAPMLSFANLRDDIYDRMLREYGAEAPRPALHQPEQQAGDLTRLPAFPNAVGRSIASEPALPVSQPNSGSELLRQADRDPIFPERVPEVATAPPSSHRASWLQGFVTVFERHRLATLLALCGALLAVILVVSVIAVWSSHDHSGSNPVLPPTSSPAPKLPNDQPSSSPLIKPGSPLISKPTQLIR